ncbi:MAG: hypothetical protein RL220_933 [Bacteroidota bacterium]|jgi:hypothetical protein
MSIFKSLSVQKSFFLIILMCALQSAIAQKTEEDYAGSEKKPKASGKSFADRLYFSGGLGLSFGTVTFVQVAPQVGYRLTDRLIPGIGANYIYYRDPFFSTSFYGGSVFTRYLIADNFFAHVEYEMINREVEEFGKIERRWIPIGMVGGGYRTNAEGLGFSVSVLWDIIEDPWSPYQNPIIRAGVYF